MKIIVVGLGNPILGDDGVGWHVAKKLDLQLSKLDNVELDRQVRIIYASLGGLSLMEQIIDYDLAIIIDALITRDHQVGTIVTVKLEELGNTFQSHTRSSHDTTLLDALQLGINLGVKLPDEIWVVGVVTEQNFYFSEKLSKTVRKSVEKATSEVMSLLERKLNFSI